ncbi:FecR domain-containing protein [Fulvivirgaceae bacterium BMA10]|uniref:FecR domain-containing protein n=1 Tax=Splendidivirga corallicola TaxID=3051826 RepID=A0ABT8KXX7_9BACT|nr:FecR domain-containing protein [Fulvivirgaceae bacterium BMA10]
MQEIIRKKLQGEPLDPKEATQFEQWINTKEGKKAFELSKKIWDRSKDMRLTKRTDPGLEWARFEKKQRDRNVRQVWFRYVAAASVVLLTVVFWFAGRNNGQIYSVAEGQTPKNFELSDGSVVWLNQRSSLEISSDFLKQKREVSLKGEAYFEITHDASKPFVVKGNHSTVTVLGTSFNYQSNDHNQVHLISGQVKFSTGQEEVSLSPGESAEAVSNTVVLNTFRSENFLSWKTGKLIFDQTKVSTVIKDLEKHFDVAFNLENKALNECTVTVTFQDESLEEVLESLAFILGIEYTIEKDKVVISKGTC